jgi:hypothetical protein
LYFAFRERGKSEARKRGDPIMAAADDAATRDGLRTWSPAIELAR